MIRHSAQSVAARAAGLDECRLRPVDPCGGADLYSLLPSDWKVIRQLYGAWDRNCPLERTISTPGNQGYYPTSSGLFVPCSIPQVYRIAKQIVTPQDILVDLGAGLLHLCAAFVLAGARMAKGFEADATVIDQASRVLPALREILNMYRYGLNLESDTVGQPLTVGNDILTLETGNFLTSKECYRLPPGASAASGALLFAYYNHSCAALNDTAVRQNWYQQLRSGDCPARLLVYSLGIHDGRGKLQFTTAELSEEFGPPLQRIDHLGSDFPDYSEVYLIA